MTDEYEEYYRVVAKRLTEGRVVPLLGAGANLCGRAREARWAAGSPFLPSGAELAEHLAGAPVEPLEGLARVAQTVAVLEGSQPLYDKLRGVFDADYPPTSLHRFLAGLPTALRRRGVTRPHQLIVTTNYDDLLEKAFADVGEPFDLVWYVAEPASQRGTFWHWPPPQDEREPHVIERPNEYDALSLDERTVILKFHGAVDRIDRKRDSYVITEDHYIEYLTRTDISRLVPAELVAELNQSHFLFLGYALRDWNVRVILHRIWEDQALHYASWAIQRNAQLVDKLLWAARNVQILDVDLEEFVDELGRHVGIDL